MHYQSAFTYPIRIHLKSEDLEINSLVKRLRHKFEAAVSETGGQETWQSAEITIVLVSSDMKFLENIKLKISDWIENETLGRAIMLEIKSEFFK